MKLKLALQGFLMGLFIALLSFMQGFAQSSEPSEVSGVFLSSENVTTEEWLERLNNLVDLYERHKDSVTVPEHVYQSNDLKVLAAYIWLLDTGEVGGDVARLRLRLRDVATSLGNERFVKFSISQEVDPHASLHWDIDQAEAQKHKTSDPDWLIALPAMRDDFTFRSSKLSVQEKSNIDQARFLEPSINDPFRDLYEFFYATMLSHEYSYALDAPNSYRNLIKGMYHLEQMDLPPLYVNGLLNLMAPLQTEIPRHELLKIFKRFTEIEFSDSGINQENTLLFYYAFYDYTLEQGNQAHASELLEKINSFPTKTRLVQRFSSKYNLEKLILEGTSDQIRAGIDIYEEKYDEGNISAQALSYWARYRAGEIDFETAYYGAKKVKVSQSLARRTAFFEDNHSSSFDYVLKDGSIQKKLVGRIPNFEYSSDRQLPEEVSNTLRKTVSRLRSISNASRDNTSGAESQFMDSIFGFNWNSRLEGSLYSDALEWSDPSFKSVIDKNKTSLLRIQQEPLFINLLKKKVPQVDPILVLSPRRTDGIDYSQLLKIVDDVYSYRAQKSWVNVLALRAGIDAEDPRSQDFVFDLENLEVLLYFLEGNSANLIDQIERQANEASILGRYLDVDTMLMLVAITLENEGYFQDAISTLDMMDLESEASSELVIARKWVRAKALMGLGNLDSANELFDVILAASTISELKPYILLDRLRSANNQGDIKYIKKFRNELSNQIPADHSDALLKVIQPEILRARYLIAKSDGDENVVGLQREYARAQQQLDQAEYSFKDQLTHSRQQAQIQATQNALDGLERERIATQAQTRLTRYLLAIAGGLSLIGLGAFLVAYREKSNVIKLNAKLDSRGQIFNRNYKESLLDTQRFVRKVSNSLEKVSENVDDIVISTRLETILEDLREHESEQTQRSLQRRNSTSEQSVVNEVVRLDSFARDIQKYWEAQRPAKDVSIKFQAKGTLPVVSTDVQYIEYALKEAVQASIDHTDYGSIMIKFAYDDDSGVFTMSITDTGNALQEPDVHYSGGRDAIARLGGVSHFGKTSESGWTAEYRIPAPKVLDFQFYDDDSNVIRLETMNDR
ncbi:MAG: hypothetical protein ABJO36_04735 [Litorimonas sp.]